MCRDEVRRVLAGKRDLYQVNCSNRRLTNSADADQWAIVHDLRGSLYHVLGPLHEDGDEVRSRA